MRNTPPTAADIADLCAAIRTANFATLRAILNLSPDQPDKVTAYVATSYARLHDPILKNSARATSAEWLLERGWPIDPSILKAIGLKKGRATAGAQ